MIMRYVLLFIFLHAWLLVGAQEVRMVNGRKHLVHTVEAGQTLYAIARVHAVPVDALLKANPAASEGLRIGQQLLVPMDAVVRKEARSAPTMLVEGELKHVAARKETLFGIAKRYQVDVNELMRRNPSITDGLREGMEVIIPVGKVTGVSAPVLRPADQSATVDHLVQPGETLFALGKRYGVKPEEIQAANGGLPEGLRAGIMVRIPRQEAGLPLPAAKDSTVVRERYHVAFLLPFSLARNDSSLAATELAPSGAQFYGPTRIAAQFYAGAQLALDSLAKQGLNAEVTVLDMGDDQRAWTNVLKNPKLENVDLFIGPFHRSAIEQLARGNSNSHIVCPVPQTNKVLLGNTNVSKVAPARSDLVKHAARYVALRHASDNVIMVRPEIPSDKEIQEQMLGTINAALAERAGRYRDSVLVVKAGRRDIGELISKLDKTRLNVIVAPSEDVEFVTTLVSKLKPLAEKNRIVVIGMESWLNMDPVASSDLDVLGFLFAAGSFADPADPRLQGFTRVYRERFKTDVDEYALLGFDVTYYYLRALLSQGASFTQHFDLVRTEPLHMGFRMGRTGPENGFRNEHGIMLQQKDLQLVKAP